MALAVAAKLGALHVFVEIGKHRNHYCTFENAAVQTVFFFWYRLQMLYYSDYSVFTFALFGWFVCAGHFIVNTTSYDIGHC